MSADSDGYTAVDASTVVATHLSELLQAHAHELIGHEEVQQLLDVLAKAAPKLVEDLVPLGAPQVQIGDDVELFEFNSGPVLMLGVPGSGYLGMTDGLTFTVTESKRGTGVTRTPSLASCCAYAT